MFSVGDFFSFMLIVVFNATQLFCHFSLYRLLRHLSSEAVRLITAMAQQRIGAADDGPRLHSGWWNMMVMAQRKRQRSALPVVQNIKQQTMWGIGKLLFFNVVIFIGDNRLLGRCRLLIFMKLLPWLKHTTIKLRGIESGRCDRFFGTLP